MPVVSVVIPTFNRERIIALAIDSVLRQTYTDYELIVVDDGSTDNTLDVLKSYGNKLRIFHQENTGIGGALNAGIRNARARWIAILGSDDEWKFDYLEWQLQKANEHPEVIVHITNSITNQLDKKKEDHFLCTGLAKKIKVNRCQIVEDPLRVIIKYSPWFTQAALMRKDSLVDVGLFDTDLPIGEDLDILARMSLKGPFMFCNKALVDVYRRQESIKCLTAQIKEKPLQRYEAFYRIHQNLLSFPQISRQERWVISRAMASYLRAQGNLLALSSLRRESRCYYKQSISISPSLRSLLKLFLSYLPSNVFRKFIQR